MRSGRTWARSYCACCTSQLSALPPKTFANLTAISGEMPRFPFTNSDKVVRVTPSAAAASVMLTPKGSMHWRSTTPPGWGGFFIGMVGSFSVVVHIVNVECAAVCKMENHSPVRSNGHGVKTLQLALERMQPETRQVHICDGLRRVEPGENIAQLHHMLGQHAARVVVFVKAFQSLVADRPDHSKP